jgi:hypothetical protein
MFTFVFVEIDVNVATEADVHGFRRPRCIQSAPPDKLRLGGAPALMRSRAQRFQHGLEGVLFVTLGQLDRMLPLTAVPNSLAG